jgi:hypothetical protein
MPNVNIHLHVCFCWRRHRQACITYMYNLLKASRIMYMHFKPAAGVLVTSVPGSDSRRCSAAHRLPSQKEGGWRVESEIDCHYEKNDEKLRR